MLITLTREDGILSGMIKNITEQKQAEESYRESQRRLTTLMDNLPGMAYRARMIRIGRWSLSTRIL